jgi:hypothetical protein
MTIDNSYTVSLLHMDGADASTTFTDESGKTWTAAGSAQIDTAQSKFGGASGLFDGTGDYISTPDSADFYYGTGAFTIESQVMFAAIAEGWNVIYFQGADVNNFVVWGVLRSSTTYTMQFSVRLVGTYTINHVYSISNPGTTNWAHYAIVRNGNDFINFVGGTGSTLTDTDEIPNFASSVYIGGEPSILSGGAGGINGWLDEVRISKGIARWTGNFTPPTSAYAPSGGSQAVWMFMKQAFEKKNCLWQPKGMTI